MIPSLHLWAISNVIFIKPIMFCISDIAFLQFKVGTSTAKRTELPDLSGMLSI